MLVIEELLIDRIFKSGLNFRLKYFGSGAFQAEANGSYARFPPFQGGAASVKMGTEPEISAL